MCIGKFDILATYVFARGLVDGLKDDEAKQRGLVAAIMGAQAKLGIRKEHHEEFQAQKESAERKNKTTITAGSFENRSPIRWVGSSGTCFCRRSRSWSEAGLFYDGVKRLLKIPATWGAKISGEQFRERTSAYLEKRTGE